jgi:2-polyprenyl-3-methyl-5-hydroxy-6-metoxy-1,4-benzoquinol methylase
LNALVSRRAGNMILHHADGWIEIEERGDGARRVVAWPCGGRPPARAWCDTSYPLALIRSILKVKGVAWVCDEISRDQDPEGIQKYFEDDFLPYVPPAEFEGKRILDFGCGSGSSTMVLARMFPRSEIVGVELSPELLELARRRKDFYGYRNLTFLLSPAGTTLPEGLAPFDFVVLSAVFEHLLPAERKNLMPQLWALVKPGGVLLVNQTPHRFFPFESHTTGIPLINYLPDRLAHWTARRLSRRDLGRESWEGLLRQGIRGATEREILRSLGKCAGESIPVLLPPVRAGWDRVDVWYAALSPRHRVLKTVCRELLRVIERLAGTTLVTNLALAIRKGTPCAAP